MHRDCIYLLLRSLMEDIQYNWSIDPTCLKRGSTVKHRIKLGITDGRTLLTSVTNDSILIVLHTPSCDRQRGRLVGGYAHPQIHLVRRQR